MAGESSRSDSTPIGWSPAGSGGSKPRDSSTTLESEASIAAIHCSFTMCCPSEPPRCSKTSRTASCPRSKDSISEAFKRSSMDTPPSPSTSKASYPSSALRLLYLSAAAIKFKVLFTVIWLKSPRDSSNLLSNETSAVHWSSDMRLSVSFESASTKSDRSACEMSMSNSRTANIKSSSDKKLSLS